MTKPKKARLLVLRSQHEIFCQKEGVRPRSNVKRAYVHQKQTGLVAKGRLALFDAQGRKVSGKVRVKNRLYMRSSHQRSCSVRRESRQEGDVISSQGISDGPRAVSITTVRARSSSPCLDVQAVDIINGRVSSLRARSRGASWGPVAVLLLLLVHQGLVPQGNIILVSTV